MILKKASLHNERVQNQYAKRRQDKSVLMWKNLLNVFQH
jgi:hypothetical protein